MRTMAGNAVFSIASTRMRHDEPMTAFDPVRANAHHEIDNVQALHRRRSRGLDLEDSA